MSRAAKPDLDVNKPFIPNHSFSQLSSVPAKRLEKQCQVCFIDMCKVEVSRISRSSGGKCLEHRRATTSLPSQFPVSPVSASHDAQPPRRAGILARQDYHLRCGRASGDIDDDENPGVTIPKNDVGFAVSDGKNSAQPWVDSCGKQSGGKSVRCTNPLSRKIQTPSIYRDHCAAICDVLYRPPYQGGRDQRGRINSVVYFQHHITQQVWLAR